MAISDFYRIVSDPHTRHDVEGGLASVADHVGVEPQRQQLGHLVARGGGLGTGGWGLGRVEGATNVKRWRELARGGGWGRGDGGTIIWDSRVFHLVTFNKGFMEDYLSWRY